MQQGDMISNEGIAQDGPLTFIFERNVQRGPLKRKNENCACAVKSFPNSAHQTIMAEPEEENSSIGEFGGLLYILDLSVGLIYSNRRDTEENKWRILLGVYLCSEFFLQRFVYIASLRHNVHCTAVFHNYRNIFCGSHYKMFEHKRSRSIEQPSFVC